MTLDSSKVSYYMNGDYYTSLIDGLKDWGNEAGYASQNTRREIELYLFREARLLDEGKMEDWLEMFSSECLYWIPISPGVEIQRRRFRLRLMIEDVLKTGLSAANWLCLVTNSFIKNNSNVKQYRSLE